MKSLESNWRSPKPIEKASINSIAWEKKGWVESWVHSNLLVFKDGSF
jgi:superfamily I DNA/RNA helicase